MINNLPAIGVAPLPEEEVHCEITGNTCTSDMWTDLPCTCQTCQRWIVIQMAKVKNHADSTDAANKTLENVIRELTRKLANFKDSEVTDIWWDVVVNKLANRLQSSAGDTQGILSLADEIRQAPNVGVLMSLLRTDGVSLL